MPRRGAIFALISEECSKGRTGWRPLSTARPRASLVQSLRAVANGLGPARIERPRRGIVNRVAALKAREIDLGRLLDEVAFLVWRVYFPFHGHAAMGRVGGLLHYRREGLL